MNPILRHYAFAYYSAALAQQPVELCIAYALHCALNYAYNLAFPHVCIYNSDVCTSCGSIR